MRILIVLFIFLLASAVLAADGSNIREPPRTSSAVAITTRYLCDSKTATGACDLIDDPPELADDFYVHVDQSDDCTGYTVDIEMFRASDSDAYVICTLGFATQQDCFWSRVNDGPLLGAIRGNVTAEANCTDLDIVGTWYLDK